MMYSSILRHFPTFLMYTASPTVKKTEAESAKETDMLMLKI